MPVTNLGQATKLVTLVLGTLFVLIWAPHPAVSDEQTPEIPDHIDPCSNLTESQMDGVTGHSNLALAAEDGNLVAVCWLLAQGVNVNRVYSRNLTALHGAALNGHTDVVKALLAGGADVNAADTDGNTALHRASSKGDVDTVVFLIYAGANIQQANNDGATALHFAVWNEHEEVLRALLVFQEGG